MYRRLTGLLAAAVVMLGVTACEPAPPRLALTVNTTSPGGDDDPGDGLCTSAPAGGACTLQAAIEEGNTATDGADVSVPAGIYGSSSTTITGNVRIVPAEAAQVSVVNTTFTVAPGGHLDMTWINTSGSSDHYMAALELVVAGSASLRHTAVSRLAVDPGGVAALFATIVGGFGASTVDNRGTIVAMSSSFFGAPASGGVVVSTAAGAQTHLRGTVVSIPDGVVGGASFFTGGGGTCGGEPPTSHGHLFTEVHCGSSLATGDATGRSGTYIDMPVLFGPTTFALTPDSPLVDAIPLGDPGCDPSEVDVYGNPRGVDGDGDGIGGCDIGAIEFQPAI